MAIVHIENAADFQPEVLDAKGKVLVDFWASWCGPCMMMAPVLEQLDEKYPDLKVVKVNVDAAQEPAVQFGIDSIPAFLLFEDGKVTKKTVGAMPLEALAQRLGL
ncbi:MAG: thioredoxin [Oscillospiraceae bacterium]|jgi:thioredoxin 1|nr:thioredoxin [Oscillospiraceae bacterium]